MQIITGTAATQESIVIYAIRTNMRLDNKSIEYWSVGVLDKSFFQYSIAPSLHFFQNSITALFFLGTPASSLLLFRRNT
jgi:hypothetical protein